MPDENALNKNNRNNKAENTAAAFNEAQKDIAKDDDLNSGDPVKDLDEGEYARQKDDENKGEK